jgi:hypothetical protein
MFIPTHQTIEFRSNMNNDLCLHKRTHRFQIFFQIRTFPLFHCIHEASCENVHQLLHFPMFSAHFRSKKRQLHAVVQAVAPGEPLHLKTPAVKFARKSGFSCLGLVEKREWGALPASEKPCHFPFCCDMINTRGYTLRSFPERTEVRRAALLALPQWPTCLLLHTGVQYRVCPRKINYCF